MGPQLKDQREGLGPFLGLEATDLQVCNAAHLPLLQLCFNTSWRGTIAAGNRTKSDVETVRSVDRDNRKREIDEFLFVEMCSSLIV